MGFSNNKKDIELQDTSYSISVLEEEKYTSSSLINRRTSTPNARANTNKQKLISDGRDDDLDKGNTLLKKRRQKNARAVLKDFGLGVASNLGVSVDQPDTIPWKYACLRAFLWGVLYWVVAWAALQFVVKDFSSFWPPNGVYVSAMLSPNVRTRRWVPFWMIISIFTVNVAWGRTMIQTIGFVVVNNFEALLASSLIRGFSRAMSGKPRLNLLHRGDLASILLAICVGCIISANLGTALSRWQLDPSRSYGGTYIKWLGRNMVGIALIVPLALSIPPFRFRVLHHTVYNWARNNPYEILRGLIMFAALILAPAISAFVVSGTTLSSVVALYISCPLILYSGAIYGSFGASFSVLTVSVSAVTSLLLLNRYHITPLLAQVSTLSVQGQFIWMQLLTMLLISMALVFVLVLAERDRARALIEKKVQERTEALTEALQDIEIARARAETADADKAVFFSFLCHELRNPLHVVSNMAGFLEERLREQELSQVKAIKLSSVYMLALVSDVLDMGRFEAGRVVLENIAVDMPALLRNNFACAEELVRSYSLTFETHIDPAIPQFMATDPTRLQQVLNNLVSNAFKFTPKGGHIKVTVDVVERFKQPKSLLERAANRSTKSLGCRNSIGPLSSPPELRCMSPDTVTSSPDVKEDAQILAQERKDEKKETNTGADDSSLAEWAMIRINVSDTGIGIAPDMVDKIFRPYAQATISTVREYGGSGLGLAITNQIVHLMKGKLTVESEMGKGSTFSFVIPMQITSQPLELNIGTTAPTNDLLMRSMSSQSLSVSQNLRVSSALSLPSLTFISSIRDLQNIMKEEEISKIQEMNTENHAEPLEILVVPTVQSVESEHKLETTPQTTATIPHDESVPNNFTNTYLEQQNATPILQTDTSIQDISTNNTNNAINIINSNNNNFNKIDNINSTNNTVNDNNTNDTNVTIQNKDNAENVNTPPTTDNTHNSRQKRILIVDDSDMNRTILSTMIKKLLTKDTYVIHNAVNGLEAVNTVSACLDTPYDIIFMDINMPVMDGWTACEQIQQKGSTSPLIITTANKISGTEAAEKIQQSGVAGALSKPFFKSDILNLFTKFNIL